MQRLLSNHSRRVAIHLSRLSLLLPLTAFAADLDFSLKLGFEKFVWEEFSPDGSQYLEESGTRNSLSGILGNTFIAKKDFIWQAEAKLYFGTVDYDGQTWDGVPVTSDTRYDGFMLEGEVGYRYENAERRFAWDVIGRAGFDNWTRDISNSRDVLGRPVRGYTEEYTVLNLRAGTGPYWQSGNWQARFIAGFKVPLDTNEYIGNAFEDDVTLEPEGQASFFWNFSNYIRLSDKSLITVDIFYDSYRFDASDPVWVTIDDEFTPIFQPKSTQDYYGLQAGVSFDL